MILGWVKLSRIKLEKVWIKLYKIELSYEDKVSWIKYNWERKFELSLVEFKKIGIEFK